MGDIVATALTNHVFTELAGLALDAGLVDTLRGAGPFTVFAPTDDAFAKLPLDILHTVQDNPDVLKTVLLHHVIDGTIKPDGIDLDISVLHGSEIFYRQLHYAQFDLSEMSLSSLIMVTANGDTTWTGLPIFASRRFFHTEVLVREEKWPEAGRMMKQMLDFAPNEPRVLRLVAQACGKLGYVEGLNYWQMLLATPQIEERLKRLHQLLLNTEFPSSLP